MSTEHTTSYTWTLHQHQGSSSLDLMLPRCHVAQVGPWPLPSLSDPVRHSHMTQGSQSEPTQEHWTDPPQTPAKQFPFLLRQFELGLPSLATKDCWQSGSSALLCNSNTLIVLVLVLVVIPSKPRWRRMETGEWALLGFPCRA